MKCCRNDFALSELFVWCIYALFPIASEASPSRLLVPKRRCCCPSTLPNCRRQHRNSNCYLQSKPERRNNLYSNQDPCSMLLSLSFFCISSTGLVCKARAWACATVQRAQMMSFPKVQPGDISLRISWLLAECCIHLIIRVPKSSGPLPEHVPQSTWILIQRLGSPYMSIL